MAILYKGQVWPIPLKLEVEREKVRELSVDSVINALLSILGK